MEKAKFGKRFGATIQDNAILLIAFWILGYWLIDHSGLAANGQLIKDMTPEEMANFQSPYAFYVMGLLLWAYWIPEAIIGQTAAKYFQGIVIRNEDGSPASKKTLLCRWIFKQAVALLSLFFYIVGLGALLPDSLVLYWVLLLCLGSLLALGAKRQCLHDKIFGTAVFYTEAALAKRALKQAAEETVPETELLRSAA